MISRAVVVLGGVALLAVAACNDQSATAPGVAPPVVGDVAGTSATPSPAEPPRALPKVARAEKKAAAPAEEGAAPTPPPADAKPPAPPPAEGAVAMPSGFEPAQFCLMPKLGTCSIYGKKYNRIDAVQGFCSRLGGEIATYCPSAGLVARCKTPADVLTHYYGTGERKYTREEAEAKCAEKGWEILAVP